jgi:hypothetical protein
MRVDIDSSNEMIFIERKHCLKEYISQDESAFE